MAVDAPDWNQQVSVNVTSVGQIPVDITKQTLSRVLVTPDLRGVNYERSSISSAGVAVGATTEVSVGTYTGSGVGFIIRANCNDADLLLRVRVDGAQILEFDIDGVWTKWGGLYYEENLKSEVTIYDTVNNIYSLIKDYGYNYPFDLSCELRVYNPGGAGKTVNNIVMAYLVPA